MPSYKTPWKKSRTYGNIYGGRMHTKLANRVFHRCHSLSYPSGEINLPITMQDNPSKDFFFPITATEAKAALANLPEIDTRGITHIWCRRLYKSEFQAGKKPLAEFICGSGVYLIVLYPWPKSLKRTFGKSGDQSLLNEMRQQGISVSKKGNQWSVHPTEDQLRKFYIRSLLYHEVGHHVDYQTRLWSKANLKQVEEFANQYAADQNNNAANAARKIEHIRSWII